MNRAWIAGTITNGRQKMIKQHCDICDGVIPNIESYRTVFFGRGTNSKVNTGYDPTIICKRCWKKMLDGIGAGDLMKVLPDKSIETAMEKTEIKHEERVLDLSKEIEEAIVTGKEKACENCIYGDRSLNENPCKSCKGKDKWTTKGNCQSPGLKCLDCVAREACDIYKDWEDDE